MPEIPHTVAYQQTLDKYDWAVKHLEKYKLIFRDFRDANPISTFTKTDPQTGDVTYYVGQVPVIPSSIPLTIGDALYSFRGALDYLACGLADAVGPNTKFPIHQNADGYKALIPRVIPGLGHDALETLHSIKPYKGGNSSLWLLHKLNVIDKHHLLLAACVVSPAHRLTPDQMTALHSLREGIRFNLQDGSGLLYESKTEPVSLHDGIELLTVPAAQAKDKVGFYFAVSINEPGITEGLPVDILLDFIKNEVGRAIAKLAPYLRR